MSHLHGRKEQHGGSYWPTEAAYAVAGRKSPAQVIADLAADLRRMDASGAIALSSWPSAQALVDLAERQEAGR